MWRRRSAAPGGSEGKAAIVRELREGPTDRGASQGRRERRVLCTRATEDAARRRETRPRLLPLDGAGRLRGDVQDDAVDLTQLVDHARGDRLGQVIWQAGAVGGALRVACERADHEA